MATDWKTTNSSKTTKGRKTFQLKLNGEVCAYAKATNLEKLLKKKIHRLFFCICGKEFFSTKIKTKLLISFIMKKIGNAVKRNKISRKLKAIVQKLLKKEVH